MHHSHKRGKGEQYLWTSLIFTCSGYSLPHKNRKSSKCNTFNIIQLLPLITILASLHFDVVDIFLANTFAIFAACSLLLFRFVTFKLC